MREIVQEFGSAIIAIITAILIIGILFGITAFDKQGILKITGVAVSKEEVDYTSYRDFDALVTWQNRTKPVANYISTFGRFYANETAGFIEWYYAKDMESRIYPMNQVILTKLFKDNMFGKVLDIRKADGTSIMGTYSEMSGSIRFPTAGVYEVYFQIRDKENKTSVWKIPIAVDERRDF